MTVSAPFAELLFLATASVVLCSCPHENQRLNKWSHPDTWPNKQKPREGSIVKIEGPVLLDESPPPLNGILISPAGQLVWSPAGDYNLTSKYLLIKGSLQIGSKDCAFDRSALITLTGKRGEYSFVFEGHKFGEKFLGVTSGGTLELHGEWRQSWSKLTKTVYKYVYPYGVIYDSQTDKGNAWSQSTTGHLKACVFLPRNFSKMKCRTFVMSETAGSKKVKAEVKEFQEFLSGIKYHHVVMLGVASGFAPPPSVKEVLYATIEIFAKDDVTNASCIRQVGPKNGFVLITVKGNFILTTEKCTSADSNLYGHQTTKAATLTIWEENVHFKAGVLVNTRNTNKNKLRFEVFTADVALPTLNLLDDVTSWKPGSRIFIASTDYDFAQAEERTVITCSHCASSEIRIDAPLKYMHWGEIIDGVDERGEVALLSRNIVIQGEVEDHCSKSNGNCKEYDIDTFGGHLMISKGFKLIHIEGVELRLMGQQTDKGSYPIHFHMCEDVDELGPYEEPVYVVQNSIHHSFARCITIHGTNGVQVIDNVCCDSLGHGYFLEDGGEKRNVFDGNFGASIKKSTLILSDRDPAVFWLTNPLVYMRNNVAGGSEGSGIWYIFPEEPISISAGKGYMSRGQARHSPILEFTNNVAHSNYRSGLLVDHKLLPDGSTGENNDYQPIVDPLNISSPNEEVVFNRFTGFKNRFFNAWIRGGAIRIVKSSFADSAVGLTFAKSTPGIQYVTDSIILGETINHGEAGWCFDQDLKINVYLNRSTPVKWDCHCSIQGFTIYDGPTYAENVWFNSFQTKGKRRAGALGFIKHNKFPSSPVNALRRIEWGFDDEYFTGNRVFEADEKTAGFSSLDGDKESMFVDLDGSVTGFPKSSVVKPHPVYVTKNCYIRLNWNMAICPHTYGKLAVRYSSDNTAVSNKPILTRDDLPLDNETMSGQHTSNFVVILGGEFSYSIQWSESVPKEIAVHGWGVDSVNTIRFGLCLPRKATFSLSSDHPQSKNQWKEVSSLEELDRRAGMFYFWDAQLGQNVIDKDTHQILDEHKLDLLPKKVNSPDLHSTKNLGTIIKDYAEEIVNKIYGPEKHLPKSLPDILQRALSKITKNDLLLQQLSRFFRKRIDLLISVGGKPIYQKLSRRILFIKLVGHRRRSASDKLTCPDDLCPMVRVLLGEGNRKSNHCTSRLYGPYKRENSMCGQILRSKQLSLTQKFPPEKFGAWSTKYPVREEEQKAKIPR